MLQRCGLVEPLEQILFRIVRDLRSSLVIRPGDPATTLSLFPFHPSSFHLHPFFKDSAAQISDRFRLGIATLLNRSGCDILFRRIPTFQVDGPHASSFDSAFAAATTRPIPLGPPSRE
jgi:hypothetical protein